MIVGEERPGKAPINLDGEIGPSIKEEKLSALEVVYGWYKEVGRWIVGDADSPSPDDVSPEEKLEMKVKNPARGLISLAMLAPVLVGSFMLNIISVGAFLPSDESFDFALAGWAISINPVPVCAIVLTVLIAGIGCASNKPKADNDQGAIEFRKVGMGLIGISAALAAYRSWLFFDRATDWSTVVVVGTAGILTFLTERGLLLLSGSAFEEVVEPLVNRIFRWFERIWRVFRLLGRIVLGVLAFVALLPILIGAMALKLLAGLPAACAWLVSRLVTILRSPWLFWRKWKANKEERLQAKQDSDLKREERRTELLKKQLAERRARQEQLDEERERWRQRQNDRIKAAKRHKIERLEARGPSARKGPE